MTNLLVEGQDGLKHTPLALLSLLARWFDSAADMLVPIDWDEILRVAAETKTIGLLGAALGKRPSDVPPDVITNVADARRQILIGNLRNLDWTVKTVAPLQGAGIDTIVFKGALRSHQVYATWDARRSSDIDLLVRHRDYARARDILIADGMVAQVPNDSVWWHDCLGESPYVRPDSASPIVDLHHSVQQPGGPYPALLDEFFERSIAHDVGSHIIRTLSPHHALLVCAISYGKAVRARKPWLAEIHEFAWSIRAMTQGERATFLNLAERNRLLRLVTECLQLCDILFSRQAAIVPEREALALASVGIYPDMQFERLGHLWKWIDGAGPIRIGRFGSELLRIVRSEIALRREGLAVSG